MRHHDRSRYPMTLGSDEFFLLGDNVPVSVDSREVGSVGGGSILGKCLVTSPVVRD